jgi:DNA-binding SARP family transcriptional activator
VGLSIHLLGKPFATVDDVPVPPPRGRKAWGLLAYLLGRAPTTREHLASLLFGDADDPLGALRWNLAELRKLIGDPGALGGQLVALGLPPGTYVDIRVLTSGSWLEAVAVPSLDRELLEGKGFASSPAFEAWLLSERRRLRTAAEGALHEAALFRLASGQESMAVDLAARLVALNPYEEAYQELLIRSYAVGGDREGAARQLAACVELYRRELGVAPGRAVFAAVEAAEAVPAAGPVSGRAAARAQLEAGEAAINAGALGAGLQCLRRAAAGADACGDLELQASSLFSLGSALVYAAQDSDEEGAAALHRVILIAERTGQRALASSAAQVLALVESLRGRYDRALTWLDSAARLGGDDDAVKAGIFMFLGSFLVDTGDYARAKVELDRSVAHAQAARDLRTLASSVAELSRLHLLRNELKAARDAAGRSLELARRLGMTTFLPFPESVLGRVELAEGNLEAAADHLEHAFALGCQIGDPCWEGLSGAGLGLLSAARDDPVAALGRLEDARKRCIRSSDASVWILAYVLDTLCTVGLAQEAPGVARWVSDLEALAGRTGMREFLVRAYMHRHDLGERGALDTARLLAADVDNPHLQTLLAQRAPARRPA